MKAHPLNPYKFQPNDTVISVYTNRIYKVIIPDKNGMAKLLNVSTNVLESWNSCNNTHFVKCESEMQLSIF